MSSLSFYRIERFSLTTVVMPVDGQVVTVGPSQQGGVILGVVSVSPSSLVTPRRFGTITAGAVPVTHIPLFPGQGDPFFVGSMDSGAGGKVLVFELK